MSICPSIKANNDQHMVKHAGYKLRCLASVVNAKSESEGKLRKARLCAILNVLAMRTGAAQMCGCIPTYICCVTAFVLLPRLLRDGFVL